jgi:hypothetical protein
MAAEPQIWHYRELMTKEEGEAWFASAPGVK